MPRLEVYQAINNPDRVFYGRTEYLEYLRVRRRERLSWARLCRAREAALQRLHGIRECQDWQEVEAFLNDHTRDIDILADRDDCPITDIRLKIDKESMERVCWRRVPFAEQNDDEDADEPSGERPAWKGSLQYSYARSKKPQKKRMSESHALRSAYDLPYRRSRISGHNDVFDAIGIHTLGGGGANPYRYSMMIFQSDFDHLRVMERLAA